MYQNQQLVDFDLQVVEAYHQGVPFRGDRLRGIRLHKQLRQAELARRAEINRTGLKHLEDGRTPNPRADTIDRLSACLDVTPDYLLGVGPDLPFDRAAILQSLELFLKTDGWRHQNLDRAALNRAAGIAGAAESVAQWRVYVEMRAAERVAVKTTAPPMSAREPRRARSVTSFIRATDAKSS